MAVREPTADTSGRASEDTSLENAAQRTTPSAGVMPRAPALRAFEMSGVVAPFGRFEGTGPTEYPANEVLVGRERERARMLDWLLTMGARGAYLVTGFRGSGKTSFVDYCTRRHAEDVFGRYQRSRVNRKPGDRLVLPLIVAAMLAVPFAASQSLQLWLPLRHTIDDVALVLWCIGTAGLFAVAALPAIHAVQIFRVASDFALTRGRPVRGWSRFWKLGALWISAAVLIAFGPFAEPVLGTAFFVALLAWVDLVIRALSVSLVDEVLDGDIDEAGFQRDNGSAASGRLYIAAWVVVGALGLLSMSVLRPPDHLLRDYLIVAAVCVALSWAWRLHDLTRRVVRLGLTAFAVCAAALGFGALASDPGAWDVLIWTAPSVVLFVAVLLWSGVQPRGSGIGFADLLLGPPTGKRIKFLPRPRLLLAFKGCFAAVLAAQFLFEPLAAVLSRGTPLTTPAVSKSSLVFRFGESTLTDAIFASPLPTGLLWIGLNALLIFALIVLEYDWIIRRHERARADNARDPWRFKTNGERLEGALGRAAHIHENLKLARSTVLWSIYDTWLPVLTVKVNLGFDDLLHSRVVISMLEALRTRYFATFVSWRSRLGLSSRLTAFALLMLLSFPVGEYLNDRVFEPATARRHEAQPATRTLAAAYWQKELLVIRDPNRARADVLRHVLPYRGRSSTIVVRAYHLIAFCLLAAMLFVAGQRFRALFYYSALYRRIGAVLRSLSSTTQRTRTTPGLAWSTGLAAVATSSRESRDETPIQQPWQVEQRFLEILQDLQYPAIHLPGVGPFLSLPVPEITFVFDELDKVGVASADSPDDDGASAEEQRNRRIRRLLADMKNLLSVAPARFIFVGGRDLHDEWLADRTARHPLLSNVFDAEIYIPSLLIDPVRAEEPQADIGRGVRAYFNAQLTRAALLHERCENSKLTLFESRPAAVEHYFVQDPDVEPPEGGDAALRFSGESPPYTLTTWPLYYAAKVTAKAPSDSGERVAWAGEFFRQCIGYFAFRSRGNPKRLDAMLESFVRPVGQVVENRPVRWQQMNCKHVLYFEFYDRFRIRMLSQIFDRLCDVLGSHAGHRDDKVVRATFYLAEFLFKFHRRAFSWSSLERIDELVHVHRSPDLRDLLTSIVQSWSQCYLQPILNGMYAFRFRSEFAAEIRFIARAAEEEMAAFNFTLDESKALKAEYQRRLGLQASNKANTFEAHAALGELYDWDAEFDQARLHYRSAIQALDASASKEALETLSTMLSFSRGVQDPKEPSSNLLRRQVDWGILRVRLMLQIGMTFERSRDYQSALLEYRNARTLARAIWFSMLDDYGRGSSSNPGRPADEAEYAANTGARRLHELKHLHLVYQAVFACAWVAEKSPSGIDTGPTMVEEALWDLRERLPFVRAPDVLDSKGPVAAAHANFALAIADLHHNAGNLYFMKGHQREESPRSVGYLRQAQYHFACAIHEVLRTCRHRMRSAVAKFAPDILEGLTPFAGDVAPQFVLRRLTSALFGLANVCLARVRLNDLLEVSSFGSETPSEDEVARWFAGEPPATAATWVGRWKGVTTPRTPAGSEAKVDLRSQDTRVISLNKDDGQSTTCLRGYLYLSSTAIELLRRGGYFEEAGKEHLQLASSIDTLLWSLSILRELPRPQDGGAQAEQGQGEENPPPRYSLPVRKLASSFAGSLLDRAASAVEEARKDYRRAFAGSAASEQRIAGGSVRYRQPTHLTSVACSLGLLAGRLDAAGTATRIWNALEDVPATLATASARDFRFMLRQILDEHAYSVLGRLSVLRTMALDDLVRRRETEPDDGQATPRELVIDELIELNEVYASPLHFTPFLYGTVLAVFARKYGRHGSEAEQALRRARQMYTSQAAYYESVAKLYYLDDDFNDREIQTRHAWQMLGSDLIDALLPESGGERAGADAGAAVA